MDKENLRLRSPLAARPKMRCAILAASLFFIAFFISIDNSNSLELRYEDLREADKVLSVCAGSAPRPKCVSANEALQAAIPGASPLVNVAYIVIDGSPALAMVEKSTGFTHGDYSYAVFFIFTATIDAINDLACRACGINLGFSVFRKKTRDNRDEWSPIAREFLAGHLRQHARGKYESNIKIHVSPGPHLFIGAEDSYMAQGVIQSWMNVFLIDLSGRSKGRTAKGRVELSYLACGTMDPDQDDSFEGSAAVDSRQHPPVITVQRKKVKCMDAAPNQPLEAVTWRLRGSEYASDR